MKNSVGEEGANSLSSSAPKNGAHIASVKAGTSNKRNTTFLPLLISSAREGNSLSRYVNTYDIEAQLNKIERISSISASQIDDDDNVKSRLSWPCVTLAPCGIRRLWPAPVSEMIRSHTAAFPAGLPSPAGVIIATGGS